MKMIEKHINNFLRNEIKDKSISIYNEFSLQHELGIYLRKMLNNENYTVEFERNIGDFKKNNNKLKIVKPKKKEIDIVIRHKDSFEVSDTIAIELKYPRNGAFPKRMTDFDKDIDFMKQLKNEGFKEAYVLTLVEQEPFYKGKNKKEPYKKYRTVSTIKNGKVYYVNNDCDIKWLILDNDKYDKNRNECLRLYYIKEIYNNKNEKNIHK